MAGIQENLIKAYSEDTAPRYINMCLIGLDLI